MKIGIFPGSFNPVHIGHLAIANHLAEQEGYDQIWFLVTPQNPLKKKGDLLDQEIRLDLVKRSIAGYEKFQINTIEWELPQPSYTINTLQKLRMLYPTNTFELIIGSDNWDTFHRWKDYQLILKNFKVVIYPRSGSSRLQINHPHARLAFGAPKINISSTTIRGAIQQGKDLRFYMPTGLYEEVAKLNFFKKPEEASPSKAE